MISVAGERARQDFSIEFSQSVNHRVLCVDDDFVALHWDSGKAITFARRKSNQQKKNKRKVVNKNEGESHTHRDVSGAREIAATIRPIVAEELTSKTNITNHSPPGRGLSARQ